MTVKLALPLSTQDKLRRAQALLSHAVPSGDVAEIVDRALDALLVQLEKRKRAATRKPRKAPVRCMTPKAGGKRNIPASMRRAVWQRDGGRCTFVSESGRRCSGRKRLEFDHLEPVARGGETSVANLRLLCRAHNQYEAERRFGRAFMDEKRRVRTAPTHGKLRPPQLAPGQVGMRA